MGFSLWFAVRAIGLPELVAEGSTGDSDRSGSPKVGNPIASILKSNV